MYTHALFIFPPSLTSHPERSAKGGESKDEQAKSKYLKGSPPFDSVVAADRHFLAQGDLRFLFLEMLSHTERRVLYATSKSMAALLQRLEIVYAGRCCWPELLRLFLNGFWKSLL